MEKVIVPVMGPMKILAWNNFKLPKFLKEKKIELYHGFKHFTLFPGKTKLIFTLHSGGWWLYPSLFKKSELFFWRTYYALGAKKADLVITVSESDKRILVEKERIKPEKVKAIHLAPDPKFTKITKREKLEYARAKYNLPDKYILFVGTIYPFKNIDTVISAFSSAKKQTNLPHKLVIVGSGSKAYGKKYRLELEALAKKENIDAEIVWVGPVYDELPEVYTMADLFLFPSIYESFCKPPLEAMACGTPVIVSGEGGLPEVVGDAALIKGCKDVEGIGTSIVSILKSKKIQQELIEKGIKQAGSFSNRRLAEENIAAYEGF